ncbi:MAG: hypothetical protein Q4D19_05795, partial [Lautropia sp.]|nr:hypothetical protein [Lautropia sp.]
EVVRGLTNARAFLLKGQAHNAMTAGCMPQLVGAFLERPKVSGLDTRCLNEITVTPPALSLSSE